MNTKARGCRPTIYTETILAMIEVPFTFASHEYIFSDLMDPVVVWATPITSTFHMTIVLTQLAGGLLITGFLV